MRRLITVLVLFVIMGASVCDAAEIMYTINANDNANQTLKFAGYEFRFNHMDHRTYLYREKNPNNGFQWATSVISCWLNKEGDPESKQDLWLQFHFGGPVTLVEPGQVYTKYFDGRNIQMIINKVAYFTGYRPAGSAAWAEETLPKYVTITLIVH